MLSKKWLPIVSSVASFGFILAVQSCGSDKDHPSNTASTDTPVVNGSVTVSSIDSGHSVQPSSAPLCENPIRLEEAGLSPITKKAQMPTAKLTLSEMLIYRVDERTNNSLLGTATERTRFKPELVCNGMGLGYRDGNSHSSTTGSDGSHMNRETTYTDSVTAEGKISTWLDVNNKSPEQRLLRFGFKNGKLIESVSELVPESNTNTVAGDFPLDRIQLKQNQWMTFRMYLISKNSLDVRVKFEQLDSESGKMTSTFYSFIFRK
jgi:hypothetical protein